MLCDQTNVIFCIANVMEFNIQWEQEIIKRFLTAYKLKRYNNLILNIDLIQSCQIKHKIVPSTFSSILDKLFAWKKRQAWNQGCISRTRNNYVTRDGLLRKRYLFGWHDVRRVAGSGSTFSELISARLKLQNSLLSQRALKVAENFSGTR